MSTYLVSGRSRSESRVLRFVILDVYNQSAPALARSMFGSEAKFDGIARRVDAVPAAMLNRLLSADEMLDALHPQRRAHRGAVETGRRAGRGELS